MGSSSRDAIPELTGSTIVIVSHIFRPFRSYFVHNYCYYYWFRNQMYRRLDWRFYLATHKISINLVLFGLVNRTRRYRNTNENMGIVPKKYSIVSCVLCTTYYLFFSINAICCVSVFGISFFLISTAHFFALKYIMLISLQLFVSFRCNNIFCICYS